MAKVKISISLDENAYKFLQDYAEQESRSVSQQINKLILDLMKEREGK